MSGTFDCRLPRSLSYPSSSPEDSPKFIVFPTTNPTQPTMHLQQLLLPVVYLATFARAGSVCLSVMDHPKDGQVDSNYEFTAFPPGHACDSGYLMSGGGSVLSNVVTQANFCDSLPIDIEVCGTKATLVKIDDAAPLNGMPKNQRCGVRLQIGNTVCRG